MAYITHHDDMGAAAEDKALRQVGGGFRRLLIRIGDRFVAACERQAEREFLMGHYSALAEDTGTDRASIVREAEKSFWKH